MKAETKGHSEVRNRLIWGHLEWAQMVTVWNEVMVRVGPAALWMFEHLNPSSNGSCTGHGAGCATFSMLLFLVSLSGPMTSTPSVADVTYVCISKPDIPPELQIHSSDPLHDSSTCISNRHLRFYVTCLPHPSCSPESILRLINSITIKSGVQVQIEEPR